MSRAIPIVCLATSVSACTWITDDDLRLRRPEVCDDGIDNDADGDIDCADLDCEPWPTNLAIDANVTATSSFIGYEPERAVDGSRDTRVGGEFSWTHEDGDVEVAELRLRLPEPINVGNLEVYSTEGFEMQGFSVAYHDGSQWESLASAYDLTKAHTSVTFPSVITKRLKFFALVGASTQPNYARFNEVELYQCVTARTLAQRSSNRATMSFHASLSHE